MLLTITCSSEYYPHDDIAVVELSSKQVFVIEFALALPTVIHFAAPRLDLEYDETREASVQVDIKKFHPCAVNTPDIRIQAQFAESYPGDDIATVACRELAALINQQLEDAKQSPTWAIDVFWGPVHGSLMFMSVSAIEAYLAG